MSNSATAYDLVLALGIIAWLLALAIFALLDFVLSKEASDAGESRSADEK